MNDSLTMRRTPKQARSQRRVNQILDTAEQIFAEVGYEHTTTNAIAARADVPIGSLYQFFPSKEAILQALIERYTEEMTALLSDPTLEDLPIPEVIGQMVDRLAVYDQTHAGFKMMLASSGISDTLHTEVINHVNDLLRRRYPQLDTARCHQSAVIAVAIVKGLMPLSRPPDNLPADQVLSEVKIALIAYLHAVLQREGIAS
jgi:AcrR family transcriptional regulator